MDVSLLGARVFFILSLSLIFLNSCGNRFDTSTARGRQAIIDEANSLLSQGNCSGARTVIGPLYDSSNVTDEIRIIRASAEACFAGFKMLAMIGGIAGTSNYFGGIAKALTYPAGTNMTTTFYSATDIMTRNGSAINASARSARENTFMVFLQMGVISSILRLYGNPASSGAQGSDLVYDGTGGSPANEMLDVDACALSAALSILSDSFNGSSLTDSDSAAVKNSLNSICVTAGAASCAAISKVRTACDGTNAASVTAEAVVDGVNASWQ